MDLRTLESFISLGLKEQEARVYLALLKLGQTKVGEIADKSGIQRTFIYDILDKLQVKGLVSSVEIRGRMRFSAVSVERFKKIQLGKLERFEKLIPELQSLVSVVGDRPKVMFFEGKAGIKQAQEDTLELPNGSEFLSYATGEGLYNKDPEFAMDYINARIKKRISVRAIAPDTSATREFTDKDKKQLRQTRLVPEKIFPFANEIDIYGNKVMLMSLTGELIAVIIESESTARTMRAIFELAWLGAEKQQAREDKKKIGRDKGEPGRNLRDENGRPRW